MRNIFILVVLVSSMAKAQSFDFNCGPTLSEQNPVVLLRSSLNRFPGNPIDPFISEHANTLGISFTDVYIAMDSISTGISPPEFHHGSNGIISPIIVGSSNDIFNIRSEFIRNIGPDIIREIQFELSQGGQVYNDGSTGVFSRNIRALRVRPPTGDNFPLNTGENVLRLITIFTDGSTQTLEIPITKRQ